MTSRPLPLHKTKVAVHLHLYYTDLLFYFVKHLSNITFPFDLYVTTTNSSKKAYIRDTCIAGLRNARTFVKIVENKGRDTKPFYVDLKPELERYDIVCHLHSKKSKYANGAADGWLEHLVKNLLRSKQSVSAIVRAFKSNPEIGLIFPTTFSGLPYWANHWLSNLHYANQLSSKIGLKQLPKDYFSYPVGNMFWARVQAIKPVFDINLNGNDFENEPDKLKNDGELCHALERIVSVSAAYKGYKNIMIDAKPQITTFLEAEDAIDFSQYHHNSLDNLRETINTSAVKIVSFDIFDTLVCRPLSEPDEMFDIMEPQILEMVGKPVEFRKIRKAADGAVRATLQHGFDVTLDAIYNEIGKVLNIDQHVANRIKELELSFEKKLLKKRAAVVHEMEYAFSIGKRVILASDMYLSKSQLRNLLQHLGINAYHDLYVSSEVGFRKDARTLFPHILEKEGVKPEEMIHVGDNEHSDIQVAVDLGIKTFHVRKTKDLFFETKLAKSVFAKRLDKLSPYSRTAFSMGINKLFDDPFPKSGSLVNGNLKLFGYFYIGPLLLSFTKWLAETAEKEKIKKLLFLSRDGEILHEIYKLLEKNSPQKMPKADYIEISRQALGGPFLKTIDDVYKVLNTSYGGDTLKNFFNTRFGLDISYVENEVFNKYGYEDMHDRVYIPDALEKLKPLAEYIFQTSKEVLESKRKNTIKYLRSKKLFDGTKKAIVDIGYSGTMQKYLNDIVGKPIHGLYMVTFNSIQYNIGRPGIFTKGLFGDNIDPWEKTLPIDKYSLFYEMILSSVKGPAKEYWSKKFKRPQPVYEQVSLEEKDKLWKLPLIHKGIMEFCEDYISTYGNTIDIIPQNDLDFLQEPFKYFHEHPALEDIIMLSGYSIDDYFCGHGILYWAPPAANIADKNYNPGKFLWKQALDAINKGVPEKINELVQSHNARYSNLGIGYFDTPRDKEIYDWYQNEFEVLPGWYKKINKIIQLMNGTKRIKLVLQEKDEKRTFNSKAEEIQEWYNKEYENMPGWYKKTGHIIKIVKGQKKIDKYFKKR